MGSLCCSQIGILSQWSLKTLAQHRNRQVQGLVCVAFLQMMYGVHHGWKWQRSTLTLGSSTAAALLAARCTYLVAIPVRSDPKPWAPMHMHLMYARIFSTCGPCFCTWLVLKDEGTCSWRPLPV